MAKTFTPARLEAFSDGVIAVIITIMVLELKVPRDGGLAGLRGVLPTLGVYALSFTFVGTYWINHHTVMDRMARCTHRVLWANLVFLFFLSLLPFFTGYTAEHHEDPFSVALYGSSLLLAGLSFLLLRLAVEWRQRVEGTYTQSTTVERLKHCFSLAVYAGAVVLAFRFPHLAMLLFALTTLAWVLPGMGVAPGGAAGDSADLPAASSASRLHSSPE